MRNKRVQQNLKRTKSIHNSVRIIQINETLIILQILRCQRLAKQVVIQAWAMVEVWFSCLQVYEAGQCIVK